MEELCATASASADAGDLEEGGTNNGLQERSVRHSVRHSVSVVRRLLYGDVDNKIRPSP